VRSALSLSALLLWACEGADLLYPIPHEPDAARNVGTDAEGADVSYHDAGEPDLGPPPACIPSDHIPEPCELGGCYGAVLCLAGRLQCVAPPCTTTPDECETADYVFLIDRSGSMQFSMASVRAATSSLTQGLRRNYFFIDIPELQSWSELPGPNRVCYPFDNPPLPPCRHVAEAIEALGPPYWGGLEYTYDALGDLPHTIRWTPGAARHVFLFADEEGQGLRFNERTVAGRLAGSGIHVHAYVSPQWRHHYDEITSATGGGLHALGSAVVDPCLPQ